MFQFHKTYFLLAVTIFLIEVYIALFVNDSFIRPYFGDFLVVALIYCSIKGFMKTNSIHTSIVVLLFSYLIEVLQYLNFIEWIGMSNFEIARIAFGTSFAWMDLLAYTAGILVVLGIEKSLDWKKSEKGIYE